MQGRLFLSNPWMTVGPNFRISTVMPRSMAYSPSTAKQPHYMGAMLHSHSLDRGNGATDTSHLSPTAPWTDLPSRTPPRLITFDPGRTEVVSSVPLCRVTPLTPKAASTCSSSSEEFRYAYQYSSSASDQDAKAATSGASGSRKSSKPRAPVRQMKLKDSQYWV